MNFTLLQQVQRQLQLRIEAQGKYLKKIIEEQQRLSGVLSEVPGFGTPSAGENGLESDNRTDPATPVPTSENPYGDKPVKDLATAKSLSLDESFSSHHHEPLTPDSSCRRTSPSESLEGERSAKKLKMSATAAFNQLTKPDVVLTRQILDSSLSLPVPAPTFNFPNKGAI